MLRMHETATLERAAQWEWLSWIMKNHYLVHYLCFFLLTAVLTVLAMYILVFWSVKTRETLVKTGTQCLKDVFGSWKPVQVPTYGHPWQGQLRDVWLKADAFVVGCRAQQHWTTLKTFAWERVKLCEMCVLWVPLFVSWAHTKLFSVHLKRYTVTGEDE